MRGRGWDDAAAMSARQHPHEPSPEHGSDPGLALTRPSLYRRLLGGSGAFGDVLTADSSDSPETQLAERLDTILNIAERLAATHDRTELFRTIVDETLRALQVDHVTIRVVEDGGLVVAAWAGLSDEAARALPVFRVDEGWVGEVLRTGQVAAWSEAREERPIDPERSEAIVDVAGDLIAPLIHHDRVIGALSAVSREPRDWTDGDIAFLTTLATHAGIALTNAELFEQTEARAAQLAVLQAASGRLNRASSVEAVGRTIVEETRKIIDYHNARVYLVELPDEVVPIAFEGRVGAYEHVDMDLLRCQHRRRIHGLGRRAWRAPADQRRERRSARPDDHRHGRHR